MNCRVHWIFPTGPCKAIRCGWAPPQPPSIEIQLFLAFGKIFSVGQPLSNRSCHSVGMATGKISRLPRDIREQVNQKLDAGEPGIRLVTWLNGLPPVRALLAAEFGGAVINEQNLTNWKQGGFREWRMEQAARALVQSPAGAAAVLAVRYLMVVREWMQSPVPAERRWRQLRMILQDVMQLRRGEQREERLALDWERLEWRQKTEARQALEVILGEMGSWPEVGAAFREAFERYERRNEARLEPIKVNQGEINFINEEMPAKLVGCPPSPQSSPPGRGGDLARVEVQESVTTSAAVGGMQMGVNMAELESIKVNQGEIFLKGEEAQDEMAGRPAGGGDGPSPLRGMQVERGDGRARFGVQESVTTPAAVNGMRTEGNETKLGLIKVDQGENFICITGRSRTRTRRRARRIRFRCGRARHPPPHALAVARAKGAVSGCACAGVIQKSFGRFYMTCPRRFRQAFITPE